MEAAREKEWNSSTQEAGGVITQTDKSLWEGCKEFFQERITGIIQGMIKLQDKALVFLLSGDWRGQ